MTRRWRTNLSELILRLLGMYSWNRWWQLGEYLAGNAPEEYYLRYVVVLMLAGWPWVG